MVLTLIFIVIVGLLSWCGYRNLIRRNLNIPQNLNIIQLRTYLDQFKLNTENIIENKVWVKSKEDLDWNLLEPKPVKFDANQIFEYLDYQGNKKTESIKINILQILPFNYEFVELFEVEIIGNYLMTFQGFPRRIKRSCIVSNNNLNSFEGSPDFIGGEFDVSHNKILNFYGLSQNLSLFRIELYGNPVYNIFYIINQLIPDDKLYQPGIINIFNDYNCWEKSGLRVNGAIFQDVVIDLTGLDFEWLPYNLNWDRNTNYIITKIDNDFEICKKDTFYKKDIHWWVLDRVSSKKDPINIQGFIKIKNGSRIIYIPSIYDFVFPTE